jgi:hypothetical protein
MNRGVELILSGGKRKKPKLFHVIFDKLIYLLKREVTLYFEFYIRVNKKK